MKLSTKSRYAARAMVEIARYYNKGLVKRLDISERQDISDSYLENILVGLKHAGLITASRGVSGGYALARDPGEISILDVVVAMEGPLHLVNCLAGDSPCNRSAFCTTEFIWMELNEVIEDMLKGISLKDVLDREKEAKDIEYFI